MSSSSTPPPLRSAMAGRKKTVNSHMLPKRRVVFVEARNQRFVFEGIDTRDEQLLEQLWWQGYDMYNCKQALKTRARQWRKTGLGLLLHDTFDLDEDGRDLMSQKQNQLEIFARLPDELYNRGIERYLSRKHDQDRTTLKRSIVTEVVAQFKVLKRQVDNEVLTHSEQQDMLGDYARRLNEQSKIFAHRIARADEAVSKWGESPDSREAEILMNFLHARQMERKQRAAMEANMAGYGGFTVPAKKDSRAASPINGFSDPSKVAPVPHDTLKTAAAAKRAAPAQPAQHGLAALPGLRRQARKA